MNILRHLVLASQSPRRIGLLRQIGLEPEIRPSSVDERFDPALDPEANARALAVAKAMDVSAGVEHGIIIGADTVVVVDGELLGKPGSVAEAESMLRKLSGRSHVVITAFALLDQPGGRMRVEAEHTMVTFRALSDDEISEYVRGGSPMDKAGAYGIQDDYGAVFVTRVEGCFYNVVGLPVARLFVTLQEFLKDDTHS
jgi:septum formation protein